MKADIRRLLFKTIAENCKLRADVQFLQKQVDIYKQLYLGEIDEKIQA